MNSRGAVAALLTAVALSHAGARPPLAAQEVEAEVLVEYQAIGYFASAASRDPVGRSQIAAEPGLTLRPTSWLDGVATVEIRADGARPERNRAYLREAYARVVAGPLDLLAGRILYRWGSADALNPTDHFGRWDYTDLLDASEEPLGQDGLMARWYPGHPGSLSLEAVVVPRLRASHLPAAGSRWWPDFPDNVTVQAPDGGGPLTVPAEYAWGGASWPSGGAGRTAWAVRASATVAGWDLTLSWYDGPSDLPAWSMDTAVDPDGPVLRARLDRPHLRYRSIGGDFATVVRGVGLHGEVALVDPAEEVGIPAAGARRWVHWIVGADRRLRRLLADRDLFAVVEWSREIWPGSGPEPHVFDMQHVFRNALMGRLGLSRFAGPATELEGVWDLAEHGWLLRVSQALSPRADVTLEVALDLLGGSRDSLLGTFRHNRRLHLRATYRR